jgi:SAM-dependent methyltransferase
LSFVRPESTTQPTTDLGVNERSVEVPWARQRVDEARRVLDVGCSTSDYLADLPGTDSDQARHIYGLDPDAPQPIRNVGAVKGTIVAPPFPPGSFDLILCISTVEHIGLPVYGQHEFPHGDILAMRHIRRLLTTGGRLLLTVPFGRAQVNPWFRVYDRGGLRQLTAGFRSLSAAFYRLNPGSDAPSGRGSYEACHPMELRGASYDFEHMRTEGVALVELTPSGFLSFLLVRALTRLSFWLDRLRGKERPFLAPS